MTVVEGRTAAGTKEALLPVEVSPDGRVDIGRQAALYWALRLACGFEFIGHGAFGLITKAAWVPYFGVVGIPEEWAYRLMPLVGSVDIFLGFLVLLKPVRAALLYMAVWGFWTALLRPLCGESIWETIERAPNYLVPAALLLLLRIPGPWTDWRAWLGQGNDGERLNPAASDQPGTLVYWLLRLATAGAFIGHGAYGLFVQTPGWYLFFAQLGIDQAAVDRYALISWVGGFEMILGLLALARPFPALLVFMVTWKIASEFIWYPMSGLPAWEFVERWSNYVAPLALLIAISWVRSSRASTQSVEFHEPDNISLGSALACAGLLMAALHLAIRARPVALSTGSQILLSGSLVLLSAVVIAHGTTREPWPAGLLQFGRGKY